MKKTCIALILFFSSTALFAQNYAAPDYGFRLGLTAHPTFGWLKPEKGKGDGLSLGFSYGLLGDFNFAENYSFSTGLTVTTINGKSTEIDPPFYHNGSTNNTGTAYNLKYKLQYLELPFTVKLRTSKIGDISWYGQFGLSNDFNIGAKQDVEVGGRSLVSDQNINDQTKFYRAGLILGAGGEFDLDNRSSITAGLTYNNGFTNIVKDSGRNVRSHYIGINFGVFF
ncbi:porin family protein [Pedobacter sp.]|uniref:porin family protein n=1 Tax=Pedobacter sp. TaxID=1411316 RepID=UPI003D7FA6FE